MKKTFEIMPGIYNSPRITREYLDCSMPMSFDQYGNCGYNCLYCFSTFQRAISGGAENYLAKKVKKISLKRFKSLFTNLDNPSNKFAPFIKNRITMQWGGLSDPFCPIEEQEGTGYEILQFLKEIKYPICFSSKSDLLLRNEKYVDLFRGMEKYWSYKASIITLDAEKAKIMEAGAPTPQDRIKVLEKLSKMGIWTIWRLRPFIPGLSNLDYEEQIKIAAKIGVKAISTEFFCLELRSINIAKDKYKIISDVVGFDIVNYYKNISVTQGYLRLNRAIKEPYYKRMLELCKKYGLNFHVSDAHGKEYGMSGSCCGLPCDKKGNCTLTNYSKCQFTNALQIAKKQGYVTWDDIDKNDYWLSTVKTESFWHVSKQTEKEKKCKINAYQFMRNIWNDPNNANSPYKYFGSSGRKNKNGVSLGILHPNKLDKNKNIVYKFFSRI